ncbi:MAG: GyrI-like domain-containing protein [Clostridiales bacterium]|nr:GyrI-like domain-containing protein [Clostridiales bacterium]
MAVKILDIKKEHCPAARLIGKRYEASPNWGEWWISGWFDQLETQPRLPFNGDAYFGMVRITDGRPERWIGMLFPQDTPVPEGFEATDIPPTDYAVCYLQAKEGSPDFYSPETHSQCLDAMKALNLTRWEDNWCFERYQCPRFTTPDENGNVILDYGISIL